MFVYYLIFVISFLLTGLDYVKHRNLKLAVYVAFCLLLILLPALRTIGTDNDSVNYDEGFRIFNNYSFGEIITGDYPENIERGFALLNKIIGQAGGTSTELFFIVAVLTGILNYLFIYRVSPFPFTSLLFYISFFYLYRDFTQIRYGLSAALLFWAVYFVINKRFLIGSGLVFCAILFHNSAFIFVLLIPLCYLIRNRKFYLILPALCLVGFFFNPLPILLSLGGIPEHMQIYLDEDGSGGKIVSIAGLLVMTLYALFRDRFKDDDRIYKWFQLFSMGVALNLLFIQSSIFQRFTFLLFQIGIFLMPVLIERLVVGKEKYYFFYLHVFFNCFLLYYGMKLVEPNLIRPYFQ